MGRARPPRRPDDPRPAARVVALAGVADRLIDLGEVDRARTPRRGPADRPTPSPGSSGGPARAAFAECLARLDPANALALTEDLVDPAPFDRCRLRIARRWPAATRRKPPGSWPRSATRGPRPGPCPRSATRWPRSTPRWPGRLIAQARGDDPCLPAYALGMMALAVAEPDKPAATAWLREAFDRLAELAAAGPPPPGAPHDPAAVAAALLPVAERVDPRLVPELFWRAASLHAPRPVAEARSDAVFALLMARYDREVALAFFEPLAARALAAPDADLEPLVAAAAVLDPALAARLVDEPARSPRPRLPPPQERGPARPGRRPGPARPRLLGPRRLPLPPPLDRRLPRPRLIPADPTSRPRRAPTGFPDGP